MKYDRKELQHIHNELKVLQLKANTSIYSQIKMTNIWTAIFISTYWRISF